MAERIPPQQPLPAGSEAFLRAVTAFVFAEDEPEKADVILVPGSVHEEHAVRAAQLYHSGYAPYILPSGRYAIDKAGFTMKSDRLRSKYGDNYASEWAFLKEVLLRAGVPEQAILREDEATFTWDNAMKSRRVLDRLGIPHDTLLLCCRPFHARRALFYYQAAFPQSRILVCPGSESGCSREDWYLTEKGRERILGEVRRLGSQVNEVFGMMMDGQEAWCSGRFRLPDDPLEAKHE